MLEDKIKEMIISCLALEDMTKTDIETDAPLFGDGLGLDSIDALEMGIALKTTFGVSLSADDEGVKKHFASVKTLADYLRSLGVEG